jgi:hypothetical protein
MHKQLSLLVIGLAGAYILSGCMGIITSTSLIVSGVSGRMKRLFRRAGRSMEAGADPDQNDHAHRDIGQEKILV